MTKMDSVTGFGDLQCYSLIQDFWQMFAVMGNFVLIKDERKMVGFKAIDVL